MAFEAKEFLNPKSMLTPGVAGGLTMLITNSVSTQFDFPANYTGLIVSSLLAFLIIKGVQAVWQELATLFILNSLMSFSIAIGTNTAGHVIKQASRCKLLQFSGSTNDFTESPREFFRKSWFED